MKLDRQQRHFKLFTAEVAVPINTKDPEKAR